MRTIKFRAKYKGEWVYGSLLQSSLNTDDSRYSIVGSDSTYHIGVNPDTVGQFTGLYDVDGKEIYEGDIVETFTLHLAYEQVGNYPPPNVEVEEWEILREVNEVDFREGSFCVGSWPIVFGNYLEQDGDFSSDEQRFNDMWESNAYDVQDKYPYLTWQHFFKPRVIGNIHDNPNY